MKKLNKLSISSEKMMKNDELINLKGGYTYTGDGSETLYCTDRWLGRDCIVHNVYCGTPQNILAAYCVQFGCSTMVGCY